MWWVMRLLFCGGMLFGLWAASSCQTDLPCSAKDCLPPRACSDGLCVCAAPLVECAQGCFELQSDPRHCGRCEGACKPEERCEQGRCLAVCPPTQAFCEGRCVSPSQDPLHCGACGRSCLAGGKCEQGTCRCAPPFLECEGACIDPRADGRHCGGCGQPCPAGQVCVEGGCVASCPAGTPAVCLGGCIAFERDLLHCGACGRACKVGLFCVNGQCGCVGQSVLCADRCVDANTDRQHCGGCGKACVSGEVCVEGQCQVSCPAVTPTVCFGGCVDVNKNPEHCGRCGNACQKDERCEAGACIKACSAQAPDVCDGRCVDIQGDVRHCGGCGKACASDALCLQGLCVVPDITSEASLSAGRFTMGSPPLEKGRQKDENQHDVRLTRAFLIRRYEVTQKEFKQRMGYNPSFFADCGEICPVENVNWHEALAFANALSREKGLEECFFCAGVGAAVSCTIKPAYAGNNYYACVGYRLPTEAEWEYAYRAGTYTAFYNGDITLTTCDSPDPNVEQIGWYCGNSPRKETSRVGRKKPNTWGLYDMAGNVWEWCYDAYALYPSQATVDPVQLKPAQGDYMVFRGGGFWAESRMLRAATRAGMRINSRGSGVGFRVVRTMR